jgi:hypothetical protein
MRRELGLARIRRDAKITKGSEQYAAPNLS